MVDSAFFGILRIYLKNLTHYSIESLEEYDNSCDTERGFSSYYFFEKML
jgi:hypothetical protein